MLMYSTIFVYMCFVAVPPSILYEDLARALKVGSGFLLFAFSTSGLLTVVCGLSLHVEFFLRWTISLPFPVSNIPILADSILGVNC